MAGSPSSLVPHRLRALHWFLHCRRGAAAVEFALGGFVLLAFLMGIINLGYLGLTLGALQHAVEQTARKAAVTAALNGSHNCPISSTIQGYFNNYAAPVIPANAAPLTYSGPVVSATIPWVDNGTPPGTYIALGATYNWKPIGFAEFPGITLSIKTVAFAMGSPQC